MTKKKKKEELFAEGPTIIENYKIPEPIGIVWKHRLKPAIIDETSTVRIYKPPPRDAFLDYLEFRMNQKSTLLEMIFGKRIL